MSEEKETKETEAWFTLSGDVNSDMVHRVFEAASEMTEDGYVFRVDLRLRPYGDSGPVVASFDMLENYLITQGREWERYAWIKGRVLTGERGAELGPLPGLGRAQAQEAPAPSAPGAPCAQPRERPTASSQRAWRASASARSVVGASSTSRAQPPVTSSRLDHTPSARPAR